MDYFRVPGDRVAAASVLRTYYLFIGVVDNAIDSGDLLTDRVVFDRLANRPGDFSLTSDVAFMSESLRSHLDKTTHPAVVPKLHDLYAAVVAEQSATSIESYIESRNEVGRLTAELSYLLILPCLRSKHDQLREFMERVGAVGCLVDSVIDLSADRQRGLLSFEPTLGCRMKLIRSAVFEGLPVALAHPLLLKIFLQSIADNVRDRFTRTDIPEPRRSSHTRREAAGLTP